MKIKNGIWVPDGDSGILTDLALVEGVPAYQFNRLEAALHYLPVRTRRSAIDVGAHVGLWTLHMSRYFKEVVAFEPVPDNIECWIKNCSGLTNAGLHHVGLSDGAHALDLAKTGSSWSWSNDLPADIGAPRVWAKAIRLDSLSLTDVDFVKIDVEGHEFPVLKGAADTIRRCRPVIMIEEKHDPERRASAFLGHLGMAEVWHKKNDRLFTWARR